jgi:hypothetical protein
VSWEGKEKEMRIKELFGLGYDRSERVTSPAGAIAAIGWLGTWGPFQQRF